jgi:3-methyladenine DNA glycosylase AlkD
VALELRKFSNRFNAEAKNRFFKTKKGEYGAGDHFWGVAVPVTRTLAKQFADLELSECLKLLKSKIHEQRLLALFILIHQFKGAEPLKQKKIYSLYMRNLRYVNNWDLVDASAHLIAGAYLEKKNQSRAVLLKLARSKRLWDKRVAILATFHFIRRHDFADTLKISKILLADEHDLIHKAVGWMLREVGNRDKRVEEKFLNQHYKKMPRTMLRYAIEKFPIAQRKKYLSPPRIDRNILKKQEPLANLLS